MTSYLFSSSPEARTVTRVRGRCGTASLLISHAFDKELGPIGLVEEFRALQMEQRVSTTPGGKSQRCLTWMMTGSTLAEAQEKSSTAAVEKSETELGTELSMKGDCLVKRGPEAD